MTSYTTISNAQVAADEPITTSLMTALRDNPIAIAEGDDTVSSTPLVHGVPYLLERLEPVADAAPLTFSTSLSGYDSVKFEGVVSVESAGSDSAFEVYLEGRASGGTWRKFMRVDSLNQNTGATAFMFSCIIENISNVEATGLARATGMVYGPTSLDRSNANDQLALDTAADFYYSSYGEEYVEFRFAIKNGAMDFEGSNSNSRFMVNMYGIKNPSRNV